MPKRYDGVFFDVGGTLWRWPSGHTPAGVWARTLVGHGHAIAHSSIESALRDADARTRGIFPPTMEAQRAFFREYDRLVLSRLGLPADPALMEDVDRAFLPMSEPPRCFDDALSTLDRLRSEGYRLGIISNASHELPDSLREHNVAERMDAVTYSWEVGAEKPDPRIFQVALDRLGVRAERAVHVGNEYGKDVRGARAAGLTPILLDVQREAKETDCLIIKCLADIFRHL